MKRRIKNIIKIVLTLRHQLISLQNVKWHNRIKKVEKQLRIGADCELPFCND